MGSFRQNMPVQPGRFFFSVTSTISADTGGDCSGMATAFAVVVLVGTALLSVLWQEPIVDVYVLWLSMGVIDEVVDAWCLRFITIFREGSNEMTMVLEIQWSEVLEA